MSGKEKMVPDLSGEPSTCRNLAIPLDLPKNRNSSGNPQSAETAGDGGVAEMMGRLRLTVQEATPFVLEDGEDDLD
jgi:hypothetical protein